MSAFLPQKLQPTPEVDVPALKERIDRLQNSVLGMRKDFVIQQRLRNVKSAVEEKMTPIDKKKLLERLDIAAGVEERVRELEELRANQQNMLPALSTALQNLFRSTTRHAKHHYERIYSRFYIGPNGDTQIEDYCVLVAEKEPVSFWKRVV